MQLFAKPQASADNQKTVIAQAHTMNTAKTVLAALLISLAMPAWSEVYRHVDEDGNVTYSDEPREGAEEIKVKPVTTVTLPKQEDIGTIEIRSSGEENTNNAPYERIEFRSPEDEESFWSGSGDIALQVSSTPSLKEGHMYEVTLDGQPVGQSTSGRFTLENVFRGTHEARVSVVDSRGRPVQQGESITFTLHRPSVQTPPFPQQN
ncbi:DUF4124 domain-containing protein [Marinobacter sp.]|uniref:DUF4124 domain-containing protein n=1 Tax=Marinobacter sp. TaxID=50741 RepID=UPI00384AD1E6